MRRRRVRAAVIGDRRPPDQCTSSHAMPSPRLPVAGTAAEPARPAPGRGPGAPGGWVADARAASLSGGADPAAALAGADRSWTEATELPARLCGRELDASLPAAPAGGRRRSAVGRRHPEVSLAPGRRRGHRVGPDPQRAAGGRSASPRRPAVRCAARSAPPAAWVSAATSRLRDRGQVREIVLRDPADKPTNVVFMGMGEPLLNWPAVDVALTILNHPEGLRHRRPAHHRVHGRHPARHGGVRQTAGAVPPGHLAACADVGPAARHHADREEVRSRGGIEGGGGVPQADDVRIRDDRRRERQRRRRRPARASWPGGWAPW